MKWIFAALLTLSFLCSQEQNYRVKNNALFTKLIENKTGPVSIAQGIELNKFFHIADNKNVSGYPQYLVKNKNDLYILVERTGRVYQIIKTNNDSVIIIRNDSTHFYGYNGDAILFSYNDTIFSFGGSGFWRNNGHLRYYSFENHEWDISQINQEIPTSMILFYCDEKNNYLYFTLMPYTDQATGKKHDEYCFYRLDLKTRVNVKLGEIPKQLIPLFSSLRTPKYSFVSIDDLNGVLVNFDKDMQYLFEFNTGEIFRLTNEKIQEIFYGSSKRSVPNFMFYRNKYVYYTRLSDSTHSLDSFKIEKTDFVKEPYHLYKKSMIDISVEYSVSFSLMILFSAGTFFLFKKKRKQKTPQHNEINSSASNDDSSLSFNAIENALINKMIDANKANRQFSAEDINVALGLGKKSLEIQKKGRTEAINRINHKFKVMYDVKEDLIQRIRSEEDRRFYKYIISEEHAKMVLK